MSKEYVLNRPTGLSCPECGGTLAKGDAETVSLKESEVVNKIVVVPSVPSAVVSRTDQTEEAPDVHLRGSEKQRN